MSEISSEMPRLRHYGTIYCIPLCIPASAGSSEDGLAAFGRTRQ
jgi:hypothetical protein